MILKDKVSSLPHICGIELDFSGELVPSFKNELLKFYNSYEFENQFQKAYFGLKSVKFKESTTTTRAGLVYNQQISIKFPSNDLNRALRLELFRKVKFVKLKLSDGKNMIFGRNDYFQNTTPKIKITSNLAISQIVFSVKSMAPAGMMPSDSGTFGFPIDVPIDFVNIY